MVLNNAELAFVPRDLFMSLLDENIAVNRFIIDTLNERLARFIALAGRDRLLDRMVGSRCHSPRCLIRFSLPERSERSSSRRTRSPN